MEDLAQFPAIVWDFLDGKLSLQELEDWLVPRLVLFLSVPYHVASKLAGLVELGLAEMSIGHCSEDEFKASLKRFLQDQPALIVDYGRPLVHTGSRSTTVVVGATSVPVGQQVPQFSYRLLEGASV